MEKIALVIAGWLLSTLTTLIVDSRKRRKERRKILTRLFLIIRDINLQIVIGPTWKVSSSTNSIEDLLKTEQDLLKGNSLFIPPILPNDFDSVLEKLAEWESETGRYQITEELIQIRYRIEVLQHLHKGLSVQVEKGYEFISRDGLHFFDENYFELERNTTKLLGLIYDLRRDTYQKLKAKLRRAFLGRAQPNNSFNRSANWMIVIMLESIAACLYSLRPVNSGVRPLLIPSL